LGLTGLPNFFQETKVPVVERRRRGISPGQKACPYSIMLKNLSTNVAAVFCLFVFMSNNSGAIQQE
jgi:hypothetical protein